MDIAKSCQKHFEKAAIHCMNRLHSLVPTDQLVLAGGCALNGVTNARILRETPFKKMYIQCAASDDGTAIGAAYYCYHNVLGQKKRFHMYQAYLGPSYSDEVLTAAASTTGFPTKIYGDDVLFDHVAGLIASGKVVGWYQGASEWGPRALGNRSILGDPTRLDMKDVINKKIKKRESFRPFAPTVLMEHVGDYFEQDILSPFMMHVVKVREEWREKMPAITHVDGTARIQSIERSTNPRYYELIDAFRSITGVAVLLNTSFNENEPIVDTPQQAVDCFLRTDMDVLVLGNNVIEK
jgi:carbamoyltransferase